MNNKGFTLIEVLLAVFIITVSLLGLYNAVNYAYHSIEKARDQFIASGLAAEGIELVRAIRDSNFVAENTWDTGLTTCNGSYGCRMDYNDSGLTVNSTSLEQYTLLSLDSSGFYNYGVGTQTVFSRRLTIIKDGDDKMQVISIVYWGDNQYKAQETLYNWK